MKGQDAAEVAVFIEDGDFMDAVFPEDVDDFHDVHRFGNVNRLMDTVFYDSRQGRRFLTANIFIIFLKDFTD